MEPFQIPESLKSLTDPYPPPEVLREAAHSGDEPARIAIIQLWLSEGIPHSFRCCPAIYEAVRCWLGVELEVHAKEISLIGSARLGKSLKPEKFGTPFINNESDLDLFVVSSDLFERLKADFYLWLSDFESERIKPRNKNEANYWTDNIKRLPMAISQGFIYPDRIPSSSKYPTAKRVNNTMGLLVDKLKITPEAPKPKKASVRCYSSWNSFVQQMLLNLEP